MRGVIPRLDTFVHNGGPSRYDRWPENKVYFVSESLSEGDAEVPCQSWTTRMPKGAQPNLNYIGKFKRVIKFRPYKSLHPVRSQ